MSKVVVIGVDGGTFDIIDQLVARGNLPNIASIMKNGVCSKLISTIPPITVPAWPSFVTGVNPGKHGVFFFTENNYTKYDEGRIVNANDIRFKTLWQIFSDLGKKLLLVGVPLSYPPQKIDGVMISVPIEGGIERVATYPPEVRGELIEKLKINLLNLRGKFKRYEYMSQEDVYEDFISYRDKRIAVQTEISLYLLKKYNWDFFMTVFKETDAAQHFFWSFMDPDHITYDPGLSIKYGHVIYETYEKIDAAIGEILAEVGEDLTIIIASDHGAGPFHKYFSLNSLLRQMGLLEIRKGKNHVFKMRRLTISRCLTKCNLTFLDNIFPNWVRNVKIPVPTYAMRPIENLIDWDKTAAYATPQGININLTGRESKGIIARDEYDRLIEEISHQLYQVKDTDTNQKIVKRVVKKEELYKGPFTEHAVDITVLLDERYAISRNLSPCLFTPVSKISTLTGNHRLEGIFIAKGPHLRKSLKIETIPEIIDVAPTILYLMGLPILAQMDGKVIEKAIESEWLKGNPLLISEEDAFVEPREISALTQEEEAETKEKLRALGYFG